MAPRYFVIAFERRAGALAKLGVVEYPSAEEAEGVTAKLEQTIPLIAGAIALSLDADSTTKELTDVRVLKAVGEFDMSVVIDALSGD